MAARQRPDLRAAARHSNAHRIERDGHHLLRALNMIAQHDPLLMLRRDQPLHRVGELADRRLIAARRRLARRGQALPGQVLEVFMHDEIAGGVALIDR